MGEEHDDSEASDAANLIATFEPATVLHVGCGTGRLVIELARRGVRVTGVDPDATRLAIARERAPTLEWVDHDLGRLDLGRTFDVVVLGDDAVLRTDPDDRASMAARCAHHVGPDGVLIAGFPLGHSDDLITWDAHAADAGLELIERWSTWGCDDVTADSSHAVSIHRRRG